jgi:hypothetical protein
MTLSDIFRRTVFGLVLSSAIGGLTGCTTSGQPGSVGGSGSGTGSGANYIYLTGNWQFQTTTTTAPVPFTSLAGFINEQGDKPGVNDLTTAALQAQPSGCYLGAPVLPLGSPVIPMQGATQGTALGLRSFSVNGQFLTLNATKDATATHLNGTWVVNGGCANGAAGTITGTQYAPLSGTFSGAISGSTPAKTLQLSLSQFATGTGDGVFPVTGTATMTGFACFTTGTLASTDGSVIGSSAALTFSTNDMSGPVTMALTGSFDPTAKTLTLTSVQVNGGSCSGSYGGATLTAP